MQPLVLVVSRIAKIMYECFERICCLYLQGIRRGGSSSSETLLYFCKTTGYHVTEYFSRYGRGNLTLICIHGDEVSRSVSVAKQKFCLFENTENPEPYLLHKPSWDV